MNNYFENNEFCTYTRNGAVGEDDECKCRKCSTGKRSRESNDFEADFCADIFGRSVHDPSNRDDDDDDEPNEESRKEERPDVHDVELDGEEEAIECTCFERKLDHVNGHSSKMCLEIDAKAPCKKCTKEDVAPVVGSGSNENNLSNESNEVETSRDASNEVEPIPVKDPLNAVPNNNNANQCGGELLAANNRRGRDPNGDADNLRPSKRVKLNNGQAVSKSKTPRTIFHKALDAVNMSWDDQHLKNILSSNTYTISSSNAVQTPGSSKTSQMILSSIKSNFNALGQPMWHESLAMCAARIDSLRSHGHTDAALRLSVSVVRTMKQVQRDSHMIWDHYQSSISNSQSSCSSDEAAMAKSSSNACCNCNCSNANTNVNSNSGASGSSSSSASRSNAVASANGSSRKMSAEFPPSRHSDAANYASSSSAHANRDGYKLYRYDYGRSAGPSMSSSSSSFRYGIEHDGCRRCLETRERAAGYQKPFDGYQSSNRYGGFGGNMQAPYFRNSFGPINHGNLFHGDQRFGANHPNHFRSSSYHRYGGANYPSSMVHGPGDLCHSSNCNMMARSHHNNMMTNEPFASVHHARPHCNKELTAHGHGANPAMAPPHLCHVQHDLKLREMINAPMRIPTNEARCVNELNAMKASATPQQQPMASSSHEKNDEPQPGCSKDIPKASTSSAAGAASAEMANKAATTASVKTPCCVKNFCCNKMAASINERPTCCSAIRAAVQCNNAHGRSHCSSSGNIYFGRHSSFEFPPSFGGSSHSCHQKLRDEIPSSISSHLPCNCCRSTNQSNAPSHSMPSTSSSAKQSIVNFGASTSKAIPSTSAAASSSASSALMHANEFVRNRKPNCPSNCLDCSVGCEIEFPLDAVACIFDFLTEACIIPDVINGPDMGRLTFDSLPATTEDGNIIPPRYQHVPVPYSNDRNETYLTLAFEAATLALGKQRIMPQGLYSQHVICKQQDQLIQRLRHVELDRLLIDVIKKLTLQLLDGGPSSGLGKKSNESHFELDLISILFFQAFQYIQNQCRCTHWLGSCLRPCSHNTSIWHSESVCVRCVCRFSKSATMALQWSTIIHVKASTVIQVVGGRSVTLRRNSVRLARRC